MPYPSAASRRPVLSRRQTPASSTPTGRALISRPSALCRRLSQRGRTAERDARRLFIGQAARVQTKRRGPLEEPRPKVANGWPENPGHPRCYSRCAPWRPVDGAPRGSLSLQSAQPRNRGTVPTTGPAARQADPHIAAKHYHLLTILQRELREQYELPQGLPHKIGSLRAKSAPSGSLSDLAVFA